VLAGLFPAVSIFPRTRAFVRRRGPREPRLHLQNCLLLRRSALEPEFQRQLYQTRIVDMQRLTESAALIAYVAVHAIELRMVPNVENVASEFHVEFFPNEFGLF
jgi:hypothetical protein